MALTAAVGGLVFSSFSAPASGIWVVMGLGPPRTVGKSGVEQVSWSAEASWEGGARGQLRPGLRLSPSLREVPWLLQERGGRPDSQWHQPFREVVLFFILFFLRHDSYPLESWVEEGVGGACVYVGVGGLCGWPVITSWTRVGPPGWESRAAMSR